MDQQEQVFVPVETRTFSKDVHFRIPTKSGDFRDVKLKCDFESRSRDEVEEMRERAEENGDSFDDEDMLRLVLKGAHGVGNAKGELLDPPDGAEEMIKKEPSFRYEAAMTYYDAVLGGNLKAKTSNKRRRRG